MTVPPTTRPLYCSTGKSAGNVSTTARGGTTSKVFCTSMSAAARSARDKPNFDDVRGFWKVDDDDGTAGEGGGDCSTTGGVNAGLGACGRAATVLRVLFGGASLIASSST